MKRFFLLLAAVGMIFTACEPANGLDDDNNGNNDNNTEQPGGGNDDAIPTDKIVIKPSTITVEAAANNYIVAVSSPCSWRATTEEDWITLETELGIDGKQQLIFAVKDYWETEPREGKIVVSNSDEGFSAELTVVQKEFAPKLIVEQKSLEYDYKGGEATISVTANFDYDITCPSWITYTKVENGVKLTMSTNYLTEPRTAEVKIFSEKYNLDRIVTSVVQTAAPIQVGTITTMNGVKGIVFYADDTVTKIMSVEETCLTWSTERVTTGATDQDNGANNMAVIKAISGWEEKYPAFKWCADYGENWYLPASNELLEIDNQRKLLNAALEANGYTKLSLIDGSSHWSSTEVDYLYACYIHWSSAHGNYKTLTNIVRAVQAF